MYWVRERDKTDKPKEDGREVGHDNWVDKWEITRSNDEHITVHTEEN